MPEFGHKTQPPAAPRSKESAPEPRDQRKEGLRGLGYAEAAQRLQMKRTPPPDGPSNDTDLMKPDFDTAKTGGGGDDLMRPDFGDDAKGARKAPAKTRAQILKENKRTLSSIDDLMSYGAFDWAITDKEANKALRLLEAAGDEALPVLVQQLDRSNLLSRLFENLPSATVKAHALTVLKLFKHRTKRDHDGVRELAIRTVELTGKDPDAILGNYTDSRMFFGTTEEKRAEKDGNGVWVVTTYAGSKSYTIGITDREIVVSVNIRLSPDAGVKKLDELKSRWLVGIEEKWNGKYNATNGTRSLPIRFRPLFLADADKDSLPDQEVAVKASSGRGNEGKLFETSTAGTAAHEFGHMIGNNDEYSKPVYDKKGVATGSTSAKDNVMSDHGKVHESHFKSVLDDLNKMRDRKTPEFKLKPQ